MCESNCPLVGLVPDRVTTNLGGARFCQAKGPHSTVQTAVGWLWVRMWKEGLLEPRFSSNIYRIHYPQF